jgi:hypothetical protein
MAFIATNKNNTKYKNRRRKMNNVVAGLQIFSAFALISYWVIFFLTEYKNRTMSEIEFKWELAFPLPDVGWIALTSVIAAIGLLSRRNYGYFFSALAGSAMMFLCFVDLAWSVQNKGFNVKKNSSRAYFEMATVVVSFIFGSLFIIHAGVNLLK